MVNAEVERLLAEVVEAARQKDETEGILKREPARAGCADKAAEARSELFHMWYELQMLLDRYRTLENAPKFVMLDSIDVAHGAARLRRAVNLARLIAEEKG